jgi:hypothetical protein
MIEEIFNNRKHVRAYDKNAFIPKEVINSLLYTAWRLTPSKNNFMPYNIFVLSSQHNDYKEHIYRICVRNEEDVNSIKSDNKYELNPNYTNIINCSYLLIYTVRVEDQPNLETKRNVAKGAYYEALDLVGIKEIYDLIALEVGLFANIFSGLCLEKEIDTSFTMCFNKRSDRWKELPFMQNEPLLLMTVGKGLVYRQDIAKKEGWTTDDYKPNYDRIVDFVK